MDLSTKAAETREKLGSLTSRIGTTETNVEKVSGNKIILFRNKTK